MKILQFFEGPNKSLSSWRLIGITAGIMTLINTWQVVVYLISVNNAEHLLRLVDSLMFFTVTCLGGGLTQHLISKKNDTNLPNPPSN